MQCLVQFYHFVTMKHPYDAALWFRYHSSLWYILSFKIIEVVVPGIQTFCHYLVLGRFLLCNRINAKTGGIFPCDLAHCTFDTALWLWGTITNSLSGCGNPLIVSPFWFRASPTDVRFWYTFYHHDLASWYILPICYEETSIWWSALVHVVMDDSDTFLSFLIVGVEVQGI